jgi:bacterial/archaeal transporter family-2 protein
MIEWLYGILAFIAGAAIALQPVVNAAAADNMGHAVWGALASATVTFVLLGIASVALRLPAPALGAVAGFPSWLYGGGVIGALMLFAALLAVPKLGAATTAVLIIVGQLAASLAVDHIGWLGIPVHPINGPRLIGALCLLGGVLLIQSS